MADWAKREKRSIKTHASWLPWFSVVPGLPTRLGRRSSVQIARLFCGLDMAGGNRPGGAGRGRLMDFQLGRVEVA